MRRVGKKDVQNGYVGVSRDPYNRLKTHKRNAENNKSGKLYDKMRKSGLDRMHFDILYDSATREEAYNMEKALRPNINMGLNSDPGGNMPFSGMYDLHSVYYIYWIKGE